jgi:hypothetical protein
MRIVTLVDLNAGPLPALTPPSARNAAWFPIVYQSAVVPPVTGGGSTPVADGVLLEWDAVESGGAEVIYIIGRSLLPAGPWEEVARTTATRYLYSDGSGQTWYFRIIPTVRGQSGPSEVIEGAPNPVTARLVEIQMAADQAVHDAAEAELKAAQALLLMGEEYDSDRGYVADDVVYLAGKMYRALQAVPAATPPPNATYWQSIGTVTEAQSGTSKALSQLRIDVDDQGMQFAAAIDQVETGLASVTSSIKAVGGGGNLVPNSTFKPDLTGWGLIWNSQGYPGVFGSRNVAGTDWVPTGGATIGNLVTGVAAAAGYVVLVSNPIPCEPGKTYMASAYAAGHRNNAYGVGVRWTNAAGGAVGEQTTLIPNDVNNGGKNLANWRRVARASVAPETAAYVQIALWQQIKAGNNDQYAWFTQPLLEQVPASQTEPSPWSAGGSEQAASSTLTLDVNGYISGTQSMNDGKRSSFTVLADIFRVISGGLTGYEVQSGYQRNYSAGAQLVTGHNFGVSKDLVFWYGPNVGAANCTKANAVIWFDKNGGAYFGGTLSAGTLKNAVQTTTTVTVGTSLVNGPFTTLGRVRTVSVGLSRNVTRTKNAYSPQGFVAGAGSNTATVQVYRKIGSGAETLWQTLNVGGGVDIFNETDAPDVAQSYWSGSATYNDSSPASDAVTYRAVITAFSEQTVTHQSGSYDGMSTLQNLSIISVEQ